jgi:hypothetical protein
MKMIRGSFSEYGAKWESRDNGSGLVHIRKIVIPSNEKYILFEEHDSFRQYEEKEKYWDLDVQSKVVGDSASIRKGILTFYDTRIISELTLNEKEVDSVYMAWGVNIKRNRN